MPADRNTLGTYPFPMVRLYCPECHRFAQFARDRLLERFDAGLATPDLLRRLQPCDRPNDDRSRCQLVYFDYLKPAARQAALDRGGLPEGWKVSYEGFERVFKDR